MHSLLTINISRGLGSHELVKSVKNPYRHTQCKQNDLEAISERIFVAKKFKKNLCWKK